MPPKVLVLQFRLSEDDIHAEQESFARVLGDSCSLIYRDALASEVDWTHPEKEIVGFSAVILPGSGELFFDGGFDERHEGRVIANKVMRDSHAFARHLLENDVPTLGICFGHQLLGYANGSLVSHSQTESKTGTEYITLTEEGKKDPLFKDVPGTFAAQYAHKDVLCEVPVGAVVLACNDQRCRFSALRFAPRVYSVQFHPERTREACVASVRNHSDYLPEGKDPESLFFDSTESEKVLRNFLRIATSV